MIARTSVMRTSSWMRCAPPVAVLVVTFGLAACANPITSRKAWDGYAGETLKVYHEDPATAGQVVWRALNDQGGIRDFLARQGEPDSLEIRGGRFSHKTIILYYTRRSVGPPHSIRLDPAKDGFTPRAPEPLATVQKAPGASGAKKGSQRARAKSPRPEASPDTDAVPDANATPTEGAGKGVKTPAPRPGPDRDAPTAEQRLTCPVDPMRADCQVFCVSGAYEWCR